MPVPSQISVSSVSQTPMNAGGILGERPFLALASVHVGSGGLPAVGRIVPSGGGPATGIAAQVAFPGFGVSLIGTGIYAVTHPPVQNGTIIPNVATPSGKFFTANPLYNRGDMGSGLSLIQVGQSNSPTGIPVPANLPTGSRIDLLFWAATRNDQNITRF